MFPDDNETVWIVGQVPEWTECDDVVNELLPGGRDEE